jgi:hypothetical protein
MAKQQIPELNYTPPQYITKALLTLHVKSLKQFCEWAQKCVMSEDYFEKC